MFKPKTDYNKLLDEREALEEVLNSTKNRALIKATQDRLEEIQRALPPLELFMFGETDLSDREVYDRLVAVLVAAFDQEHAVRLASTTTYPGSKQFSPILQRESACVHLGRARSAIRPGVLMVDYRKR